MSQILKEQTNNVADEKVKSPRCIMYMWMYPWMMYMYDENGNVLDNMCEEKMKEKIIEILKSCIKNTDVDKINEIYDSKYYQITKYENIINIKQYLKIEEFSEIVSSTKKFMIENKNNKTDGAKEKETLNGY